MCWIFADTWLEEPEEDPPAQTKAQEVWEYIPARSRKKKRQRYVEVYPGDDRPVEEIQQRSLQSVWQYVPAARTTDSGKVLREKSSKTQTTVIAKGDEDGKSTVYKKTDNEWSYIPDGVEQKVCKESSSKRLGKTHVAMCISNGVVANASGGDEHEHWPDDATQISAPSVAASGYDSHNGLREWLYHPANDPKKAAAAPPPPAAVAQPAPCAHKPATQAAPPVQYPPLPHYCYGYPQHMAYPAPAYYGFPGLNLPYCPPGYMPVFAPTAAPAPAPAPAEEKPKKKSTEPKKWQGRTKAEVEEDNMKIAQREGAYDARKVEPKGLKDEQMVWVVEVDGSHTLRAYAAVKDLKGGWKADPRFKDSWYFVREKEEEKKEGKE